MSHGSLLCDALTKLLTFAGPIAGILGLLFAIWRTRWHRRVKWVTSFVAVILIASSFWLLYSGEQLRLVDGSFEWQWAGERWYGEVTITTDENHERIATVEVNTIDKVEREDGTEYRLVSEPVLESRRGVWRGDRRGFTLDVAAVQSIGEMKVPVDLEAELYPVEAYAGIVKFKGREQACEAGDMVLVATGFPDLESDEAPIRLVRYISGQRFH